MDAEDVAGDCSPTSPASAPMPVDEVKSLEPILNLLGADEELTESLLAVNAEIMKLVGELGGSQKGYRRERAKQTRRWCPKSTARRDSLQPSSCCRA